MAMAEDVARAVGRAAPEPARQAERIVAMQRDIVLPVKAACCSG